MESVFYVTQQKEIALGNDLHTINTPDIFTQSIKGDVYNLNLSVGFRDYVINEPITLKIELINSYYDNSGGSVQYITLQPEDNDASVMFNLTPVAYMVVQNGINPLDQKLVHIAVKVVKGKLSSATLVTRSVWQKVNYIKF